MSEKVYDGYDHVKRLNAETTEEELLQIYSAWSKSFDKDMHDSAYIGPMVAADLFARYLTELGNSNEVRILDLGCGTGLVGEQLQKLGYTNIDGVDLTPELLTVARSKGIYKSLHQGRMGSDQCKELGVAADQYDAAICIGVLTAGHVKGEGLDDVVHVVKPGGVACFNIRKDALDDPQYEFQEKMKALCDEGKWKLLIKHYEPRYIIKELSQAWFYVYQIL